MSDVVQMIPVDIVVDVAIDVGPPIPKEMWDEEKEWATQKAQNDPDSLRKMILQQECMRGTSRRHGETDTEYAMRLGFGDVLYDEYVAWERAQQKIDHAGQIYNPYNDTWSWL